MKLKTKNLNSKLAKISLAKTSNIGFSLIWKVKSEENSNNFDSSFNWIIFAKASPIKLMAQKLNVN